MTVRDEINTTWRTYARPTRQHYIFHKKTPNRIKNFTAGNFQGYFLIWRRMRKIGANPNASEAWGLSKVLETFEGVERWVGGGVGRRGRRGGRVNWGGHIKTARSYRCSISLESPPCPRAVSLLRRTGGDSKARRHREASAHTHTVPSVSGSRSRLLVFFKEES